MAVVDQRLVVFTHLARSSLFLEALQDEALAPFQLSFVEYSVLRLLDRSDDQQMPPSRLAELVVRTTGGMTKIVDRLEHRGLVRRVPDPADRRSVLVTLTGAGQRLSTESSSAYRHTRERVLDLLAADDVADIDASLRQLLDALETDRRSHQ